MGKRKIKRARRLLRGLPGPRDSQTLQPYSPDRPVDGKVRCHTFIVTDVTDRAGQDVISLPPLFRLRNIQLHV